MTIRALIVALVAAAASLLPSSAGAQDRPAAQCSLPRASGVEEERLVSGDRPRSYRLFVPPAYDGRAGLPLVLELHGSGLSAAVQARTSGLDAVAAREGFVVASLQADAARWNVPVEAGRPDDVAYVADVIDHVASRVCVDRTRVYVTGFSGGARMSLLVGCRLGSRVAAIAPIAGLRWPGACDGPPVPVLSVHGLADPQNTYEGNAQGRGAEWLESVPDALASWAGHNGCRPEVVLEDPDGPLSVMRYEGCRGGAEVRLIRVDGLGHVWATDEVSASEEMWRFFRQHRRGR